MIGTRATALSALFVALALSAGCKKEVTNEQSTDADPTVDWDASGSDGGSDDTGGADEADAASAEAEAAEGPTLVIVGAAPGEAAAR